MVGDHEILIILCVHTCSHVPEIVEDAISLPHSLDVGPRVIFIGIVIVSEKAYLLEVLHLKATGNTHTLHVWVLCPLNLAIVQEIILGHTDVAVANPEGLQVNNGIINGDVPELLLEDKKVGASGVHVLGLVQVKAA